MRSFGNINMQQNAFEETVLQVETNFPSQPVPGRLVFKDLRLYFCVAINSGTPVWIPLTNELHSYEHVQSASSREWSIHHELNTSLPSVQIYGADQRVVWPDEIEIVSNNQVKVYFGTSVTGRAIVLSGNKEGVQKPKYSYEHTQTVSSDTWVADHNLGYHPITRVFVGNEEIQPMSIVHDSLFRTTIKFSQAYVGIARFI